MAIWNTTVRVVALVPAETADEAIRKLANRLDSFDLEVLPDGMSAFESEALDELTEAIVRSEWGKA